MTAARGNSPSQPPANTAGGCWCVSRRSLTRDVAETLRGALLLADTDTLPPTADPDEFYDHELAGLRAELLDGTVVGKVVEVVHSPAGELLELDVDGREVLVPFVRAIVPTVDVAGGRVVLDPPEGLLDA